jgi:hypothetical protein
MMLHYPLIPGRLRAWERAPEQAAVRRITATVNSLAVLPPGPRECGTGTGADLRLTFLTAPKGRVLASALVTGDGCQPVIFGAGATKITGVTPWSTPGVTALGVPYDGHALAVTVLKSAGLEWKLPFVPS